MRYVKCNIPLRVSSAKHFVNILLGVVVVNVFIPLMWTPSHQNATFEILFYSVNITLHISHTLDRRYNDVQFT